MIPHAVFLPFPFPEKAVIASQASPIQVILGLLLDLNQLTLGTFLHATTSRSTGPSDVSLT